MHLMQDPHGHIKPKDWTEMVLDWFEAIAIPQSRAETR